MLVFYPPEIKHRLTWRGLYVDGAFAQRELIASGTFNSRAKDRGTALGIGDDTLVYLHEVGSAADRVLAGSILERYVRVGRVGRGDDLFR